MVNNAKLSEIDNSILYHKHKQSYKKAKSVRSEKNGRFPSKSTERNRLPDVNPAPAQSLYNNITHSHHLESDPEEEIKKESFLSIEVDAAALNMKLSKYINEISFASNLS